MLVLSRKVNENIIITCGATEIILTVVDHNASKVRLGIQAPKHVTINRQEVQERIANASSPNRD